MTAVGSGSSGTALLPPEMALYHRLILAAPDPEGDEIDDQLDAYHAAINDSLNIVLANVKAASHELYLGRLNGSCAVYLPLPRFADCHTHIPTAEFQHVRGHLGKQGGVRGSRGASCMALDPCG
jgi:hypothetical protein